MSDTTEQAWENAEMIWVQMLARLTSLEAERDKLREALTQIQELQPKRLDILQRDGVVFDERPHHDPKNWQQIAFWIYTDLCETETIARVALKDTE